MAYEPGGGSGDPYNRFEDLNFKPGYSVQDWIRNQMQQGNVGVAQPMGVGIPDFPQDQMYGRTPPSDLDLHPYQRPLEEELPPADGPYASMDKAPLSTFGQPSSPEEFIMNRLRANPSGAQQPQQAMPETTGRGGGSPDELIQFLLRQMESARGR
jgi:hypothetical protein